MIEDVIRQPQHGDGLDLPPPTDVGARWTSEPGTGSYVEEALEILTQQV